MHAWSTVRRVEPVNVGSLIRDACYDASYDASCMQVRDGATHREQQQRPTRLPVFVNYLLFFDGTGPATRECNRPSTTSSRSAASRPLGHHRYGIRADDVDAFLMHSLKPRSMSNCGFIDPRTGEMCALVKLGIGFHPVD